MFPQPVCGPSVNTPAQLLSRVEDYGPGACSGEWAVDEQRINRTYATRIKIELRSQFIGPAQVIGLTGIRIGDTYKFPLYASAPTEVDTGAFVQSIKPQRNSEHDASGGVQWIVDVEYGPFDTVYWLGSGYLSTGQIDPTARVLGVTWDSAKYEISRPKDFSDPPKYYKNSIDDPLIDPPKFEETRPVLKIERWESTYSEAYATSFQDTVNEDVFLGCPPQTVKCRDIKGERNYDPDWGNYWRITYEFEFRVDEEGDGFRQKVANMGYRYKSGGNIVNALDDNQQPVTDAILLAKDGTKLAAGADPYLLEFTEFPPVSFEQLNIPQDILSQNL
jgi:hypothetical protein